MELPFKERMIRFEKYFKSHASTSESFAPEWAAATIINLYALKDAVNFHDLEVIVNIFNMTNEVPHHSGSGWLDFRGHICQLIKDSGYDCQVVEGDNIYLINNH